MVTLIPNKSTPVTPSDTNYITADIKKPVTDAAIAFTSVDVTADTITKVAHGYNTNDQVYITNAGTTGLSLNPTMYYVIKSTADVIQLSLTEGGTAMDITGTNTTAPTIQRFIAISSVRVVGTIYVGVTGDLAVLPEHHMDTNTTTAAQRGVVIFKNVPVGVFPLAVKKVFATGTTATQLVCNFMGKV